MSEIQDADLKCNALFGHCREKHPGKREMWCHPCRYAIDVESLRFVAALRARAEAAEQALAATRAPGAECVYEGAHQAGCRDGEPQCLPCARRRLAVMTAERDTFKAMAEQYRSTAEFKVAESLAREEALREAIQKRCSRHVAPNNEHDTEPHWADRKHGWEETPCELTAAEQAALAQPRDSAALDAMLMRCAEAVVEQATLGRPEVERALIRDHLDLAAILRGLR